MCEPTTTTLLYLSIASSAAQFVAQQQAANAQEASNKQTYDSQMVAYNANLANSNLMKQNEADILAEKKMANNAAASRDISKATVSAGENGVSGLSVDALLADLGGEAGRANATAESNYLMKDRAIEADRMNAWAGTANAVNSLKTPQGGDYIGTALRIGSEYTQYKTGTGAYRKTT